MKAPCDATIVGAGPAGSTLAILLAQRGFHVTLLEKAVFPREKICGEFIHPEAVPHFEQVGLGPFLEREGMPISHLQLSSLQGRVVQIPLPGRAGYGISRRLLDAMLWKQAQSSGVDTREAFRTEQIDRLGRNRWCVAGRDLRTGRRHTFLGRVVVGADGVRSYVARTARMAYPRRTSTFAAKIRGFNRREPHHRVELHLTPGGYAGIIDLKGGDLNVCALLDRAAIRDSGGNWSKLARTTLAVNPVLASRLLEIEPTGPPRFFGPMFYGIRRGTNRRLLVGDAKGIVDQFSGSGILLAVRSASRLAELMNRFRRKHSRLLPLMGRYEATFRALFYPVEWTAHAVRALIAHPDRTEVLFRRASSDERLASYLGAVFLDYTSIRPWTTIQHLFRLRAGARERFYR